MSVFKNKLPFTVHVLPFRYFFFSFLTSLKSSAHHAVKFSLINTFSAPTTFKYLIAYFSIIYCTVRNPASGLQWIFNKAIYLSIRRFNLAFSVQFALCVIIAKSGDDRSGLFFAFRVHSMRNVYVAGC